MSWRVGAAVALALFASAAIGHAQVSWRATVSKTEVEAGAPFRVTFALDGADGEAFEPPDLSGFEVIAGPNVSTSFQIVNGRTSAARSWSYDLVAPREGETVVGSARVRVSGRFVQTAPVRLRVLPGRSGPTGGAPQAGEELSVSLEVPTDTVYLGQALRVGVELYNRVRLHTYSVLRPLRAEAGLQVEQLRRFDGAERRADIGGQTYSVRRLLAYEVTPSRPGRYELGPVGLRVQVVQPGRRRGFLFAPATTAADVTSQRVKLAVLPLPGGAPTDFGGIVGAWQFQADVAEVPDLTTADALTVDLYAQGRGDVGRLRPPELDWPDGWRAYPPELKLSRDIETDTGIVRTRVWTYQVAPTRPGSFTLAPSFSYFDAERGEYTRWSAKPRTVRVGGQPVADAVVAERRGGEAEIAPYTGPARVVTGDSWLGRGWFWWALAAGPLAIGVAWGLGRRQASSAGRVGGAARDPLAEGRRRLREARERLEDPAAFYRAAREALDRYAEERLGLAPQQQTRAGIIAACARLADLPDGTAEAFLEARELTDRGLYGGGTDAEGRARILGELEGLLSR